MGRPKFEDLQKDGHIPLQSPKKDGLENQSPQECDPLQCKYYGSVKQSYPTPFICKRGYYWSIDFFNILADRDILIDRTIDSGAKL